MCALTEFQAFLPRKDMNDFVKDTKRTLEKADICLYYYFNLSIKR